jgi:AhpD family alkylhydroperoxidase
MRHWIPLAGALALALPGAVRAEDKAPTPIPATRPGMKQALEDHKAARPRLPLPPLTDEEKANLGGRPTVNNGRMRRYYLPAELTGGEFSREPDPAMTLDPTFKVMLFWIVARANDCRYCLGHQEWKLAAAGVSEERLAALDCDWSVYTPAEQAAFTLARRLTYEPHALTARDLEPVRKHYKDLQVLEILLTVGNWNAMTRWTGGLNFPQDADGAFFGRKGEGTAGARLHGFLSPTPEAFRDRPSRVAPARQPGADPRPPLESRAEVEEALAVCRKREPRLPLAAEEAARALLPADWPAGPLPQWVRLLANFPKAGKGRILSLRAAADRGTLGRRLRCQVAWIAARQDRAWYALGCARQRLETEGVSDKDVWALDGPWEDFTPGERAAFNLARKLTATPDLVADADVAEMRKHYTDKQVAELIYQVTVAAFFDRVTEAAGLRLER